MKDEFAGEELLEYIQAYLLPRGIQDTPKTERSERGDIGGPMVTDVLFLPLYVWPSIHLLCNCISKKQMFLST